MALQHLEFGLSFQTLDQKILNMDNLHSADLCKIWSPQCSHPKNTQDSQGVSRPNIWSQPFSIDFWAVQNRSYNHVDILVSTIFSHVFPMLFYHFNHFDSSNWPHCSCCAWPWPGLPPRHCRATVRARGHARQLVAGEGSWWWEPQTLLWRRWFSIFRDFIEYVELFLFISVHYHFLSRSIDSWLPWLFFCVLLSLAKI